MGKIALAAILVALAVATPLAIGRATAQPRAYLAPGAAPPWGESTTAPAATPPAPTPAATAAQSAVPTPQPAGSGTTTPTQVNTTPIQGTTTPTRAVFLHVGPNGAMPILGTLHPGESLRVLASAPGGWMQVESAEGSGWAYGSYLAPNGAAAVAEPPAPPQEIISR